MGRSGYHLAGVSQLDADDFSSLDFAQKHPRADPSRIGLIGFSLGAYLSLALGSQQQRIKAIVDFFGGLSDYFIERLTQLAPVLILHGEADPVVPVSEAHKVAQALDQRGLPYEMKLYRNAGHGFQGLDMLDAAQRAYQFLKQHLGATAPRIESRMIRPTPAANGHKFASI